MGLVNGPRLLVGGAFVAQLEGRNPQVRRTPRSHESNGEFGGAEAAQASGQAADAAGSAAREVSTSVAKVAGSLTAKSASMRRSTSTSAAFSPWMNRL